MDHNLQNLHLFDIQNNRESITTNNIQNSNLFSQNDFPLSFNTDAIQIPNHVQISDIKNLFGQPNPKRKEKYRN